MTMDTFLISKLNKAVTVKMRADVSTNSCTKQVKTNDDLGGSTPHPQDMAAANRTRSCDENKTSSVLIELTQASHFGLDLLTPPCDAAVQAKSQF